MFRILAQQHFGDTLASFIRQSTQQKGNRSAKKEDSSLSQKAKSQSGSQRGKRINYVSKGPPTTSGISRKEGKPKRVGSLEELSPTTNGAPQNKNGVNSLPTKGTWNH